MDVFEVNWNKKKQQQRFWSVWNPDISIFAAHLKALASISQRFGGSRKNREAFWWATPYEACPAREKSHEILVGFRAQITVGLMVYHDVELVIWATWMNLKS